MSKSKDDWSSWNVRSDDIAQYHVAVTYWISRIQNLKKSNVLVTVNPPITPDNTFYDEEMSHPVMDLQAESAQRESSRWQVSGACS